MKKTLLLGCALMAITQTMNAQDNMAISEKRPPMWGLEAGASMNTFIDHYQGATSNTNFKAGFHVGGLADILLTDHVYLQPGLRYSMKGGQIETTWTSNITGGTQEIKMKDKLTLHYIEVPVNLVYKFGGDDARVFAGVGAYAAALVGADSKYKHKTTTEIGEVEKEVEDDGTRGLNIGNNADDDLTRMDYGLNALLGVNIHENWFVKGSAQFGLRNLASGGKTPSNSTYLPASSESSLQNMGFALTVGYMF